MQDPNFTNLVYAEYLVRERMQKLAREVDQQRRIQQAQATRSSSLRASFGGVLTGIGLLLIRLGGGHIQLGDTSSVPLHRQS